MTNKVLLLLGILICGCKQNAKVEQPVARDSAIGAVTSPLQVVELMRTAPESKDMENAEYDLLGTMFGVDDPRQQCSKDSVYWVVSKRTYSRCLNMVKDFPDFFSGVTEESATDFSHKCVGVANLPTEIGDLYKGHFLLQKQISPCSAKDSTSLVRIFGVQNVVRDSDDETSCTIYDSAEIVDSSSIANKDRAKLLGKRLAGFREGDDASGEVEQFEFSPFVNTFVFCACKSKMHLDSLGSGIDSRFSAFLLHKK